MSAADRIARTIAAEIGARPAQEGEGRALVRNAQGEVELVSNVCRHRQAVMLQGRGSLQVQIGRASCRERVSSPV